MQIAKKRGKGPTASETLHSSWADIEPSLLALICSRLPDDERCRVVPLVNKCWNAFHRQNPPQPEVFTIKNLPLRISLLNYFRTVSSSVVYLDVEGSFGTENDLGFLPQLLSIAAVSSTSLRSLSVPAIHNSVLNSIFVLSQLTTLEMSDVDLSSSVDFQPLRGLTSLKFIIFNIATVSSTSARVSQQLRDFWDSLGRMPQLTSCIASAEELPADVLLEGVSSLVPSTSIRQLRLSLPHTHSRLWGLSSLSQLEKLALDINDSSWRPGDLLQHLPMLESATLQFPRLPGGSFHNAHPQLTRLCLKGWDHQAQISEETLSNLLAPTTPALSRSLVKLALINLGLTEMPVGVLASIKNLQHLDLTLNKLSQLPSSLTALSELRFLNLALNAELQFRPSDVDLLAALPHLQAVRLRERDLPVDCNHPEAATSARWSPDSAEFFSAMFRQTGIALLLTGTIHEADEAWQIWDYVYSKN